MISTVFPCWTGFRGTAELFFSRDWSPQSISPQQDHTCNLVTREHASTKQHFFPKYMGPASPAWEVPGLFKPRILCLPHRFPAAKNKASIFPELEVTATVQNHAQLPLSALTSLLLSSRERNIIISIFLNMQRHVKKKFSFLSLFLQFQLTAKYTPRSIQRKSIKLPHWLWTKKSNC